MLFDFGMSELLLIGVVALVVIGPKDLPKALRVAGFWVKKARTLSREFQSSVEQMIREAELDDMRQELKKASEIDLDKEFRQTIDPTGTFRQRRRLMAARSLRRMYLKARRSNPRRRRSRRIPPITISCRRNPRDSRWTTIGRPSSKRAGCRFSIT